MQGSRGLLILLGAVVIAAGAVWYLTRPRPEVVTPPPTRREPVRFHHTEIEVRSPDLAVGPAVVLGAIYPDYASWRVEMECAEPEGCAGDLELEIRYEGDGEDHRLRLVNFVDLAVGGTIVLAGIQDRPAAVNRIDGLLLEVHDRDPAGKVFDIGL